jgi:hypothetical protein
MSDAELEAKARSCCEGVLDDEATASLIRAAWGITHSSDASELMRLINGVGA